MTRSCLCVFALAAALSAAAMPSRNDLKKVQATVNELMAEDIAAMKSGKQTPEGAAAKAEELAGLATDEASKFLLYKGAFGLYVQGGKYDEAVVALDKLTAAVKNIPDKVLADIVLGKMKKLGKKDGGAIFAYYDQLDRRIRYGAEKEKFAKLVKAEPSDREARKSLAVALAALGDWKGALAEFVQAGGDEQKAAKAEESGQAASAADQWWACAGAAADENVQDVYRAHAAELYSKAIADGKIDGLKKALAEKRVAEVAGEGASGGPAAAAPQREEKKPEVVSDAPVRSAPKTPNGKYDWSVPASMKGVKSLDFDLGGEKMTFLAVPPGQGYLRSGPNGGKSHTVKVTRPFWIAQFPVTVAQYRKFGELPGISALSQLIDLYAKDDVVLLAPVHYSHVAPYFEWLNTTFGSQLPAGWVFRPPTQGEMAVAGAGMKTYKFEFEPKKLESLHSKGLFLDCKTDMEVKRAKNDRNHPQFLVPIEFIVLGHRQLVAKKTLLDFGGYQVALDRIAAPELKRKPSWAPATLTALEKVLDYKPVETDSFRYCPEDAEGGRFATSLIWHDDDIPIPLMIRVAVGYDYVGEWKRKNGK